jgi:hypothetical protein
MPIIIFGRYYSIYVILHLATANWRVALPSVRSNWSPTYILHLFHLEDTALLFLFLSESVKVRFPPRVDTFSFAQEPHVFIVSKQYACSRPVHIEGHMNRVGLNWILVNMDNNSDNDSFGSFLSKKKRTQNVNPSSACTLFRNNKQHVVVEQKRKCQREKESEFWRIQRERGIEVQYLPNGTHAGYM